MTVSRLAGSRWHSRVRSDAGTGAQLQEQQR
jgi:hypothetical protein